MLPSFSYETAPSLEGGQPRGRPRRCPRHAGGTDLLGCLRDGVFTDQQAGQPPRLEDLRRIRTARGTDAAGRGGDGLRIGALTTISRGGRRRRGEPALRRPGPGGAGGGQPPAAQPGHPRRQPLSEAALLVLPRRFPLRAASGGDFCSPATGRTSSTASSAATRACTCHPSDTAPALTALDASVAITGPHGDRTVPVSGFFVAPGDDPTRETVLGPGEIVTEILVPGLPPGARSSYRKVRSRGAWDFALVSAALVIDLAGDEVRDARVVLGGVAPVPWRSRAAEAELKGQPLTVETARRAAAAALDGAEPWSTTRRRWTSRGGCWRRS